LHNTRQKQTFENFLLRSTKTSANIFLHLEVLNHGLLLILIYNDLKILSSELLTFKKKIENYN